MRKAYAIPAAHVRPLRPLSAAARAIVPALAAGIIVWSCIETPERHQAVAWAALCGAAVFAALFARARDKSIEAALAFKVIVEDGAVTCERPPAPPVAIARADIGLCREVEGKGLLVLSKDARRAIFVPVEVEDYEGLRACVAGWSAIERVKPLFASWRRGSRRS